MKKLFCILLAAIMSLSLAACGGGTTTPSASPSASSAAPSTDAASASPAASASGFNLDNVRERTFILAHGIPAQAMTGQQYHAFAEAVKELSGGKMTIDEKVGGTLITDTESLDAVMDGTVDFIHSMGSYVTGQIPNVAPLCVYGYFSGSNEEWLKFADQIRGTMGDIYGEFGIHFVGSLFQGSTVIVCTEKLIKTPADLNGLYFRASGTWISKSIQAWGATPTTIALADLTTAFERSTVQGTATGWNIAVPFKLYEVAKNFTFTDISEGYAALLMNGETWKSLNADEQAIITEAGKVFEQSSVDIAMKLRDEYFKTVQDSGINTYTLTADEQKAFTDKSTALLDTEVKSTLSGPGLELLDILNSLRAK